MIALADVGFARFQEQNVTVVHGSNKKDEEANYAE